MSTYPSHTGPATKAELAYRQQSGIWPTQAAGLRQVRFARSTGSLIGVYDGHEAGMCTPGDGDGRWMTVCETHSRICSHPTVALALSHATCPEGWCEACEERAA